MELAAKYVYEVYKEKSFSKAAKSLYVSQPALSSTVSRLEKELGFRIFDRATVPLTLTPQGRIYIEALEEMLETESNMRRRIRDISDMSYGSLTIGGQSSTSYYLMSEICGEFHKQYPDVSVKLDIGNKGDTDVLWEKLKNDEVDIMFSYTTRGNYITEPIYTERLIIAMHRSMPCSKGLEPFALTWEEVVKGDIDPQKEVRDMSIFKDVEFLRFGKGSVTSQCMTAMLGDYKEAPYSIVNVRHSGMHYNLMCAGVGAVLTHDLQVSKSSYESGNILFFAPHHREAYRDIYLIRKHTADDNPIVRNFVKVAKEVGAKGKI